MSVVRYGKGLYDEIAKLEAVSGREKPGNELGLELPFKGILSGAIAINRDFQLLSQPGQALDVIVMLVRDEHSSEIFRRASNGRQPLADLAQRKPGINQYPNLIRF
jgi:hypothetical protein